MNDEVKRAFVLADWMKWAENCDNEREFIALLRSERMRIHTLNESELNQIICEDPHRLNRFEKLTWKLEEQFDLATCRVYDRMDGRAWAIGTVREVADKFDRLEPAGSRVWRMRSFASCFQSELPVIVLIKNGEPILDDGSHRAVALYLSGMTHTRAYIGSC